VENLPLSHAVRQGVQVVFAALDRSAIPRPVLAPSGQLHQHGPARLVGGWSRELLTESWNGGRAVGPCSRWLTDWWDPAELLARREAEALLHWPARRRWPGVASALRSGCESDGPPSLQARPAPSVDGFCAVVHDGSSREADWAEARCRSWVITTDGLDSGRPGLVLGDGKQGPTEDWSGRW